jgi:predicted DNA-binding transcriptional regulator YafY
MSKSERLLALLQALRAYRRPVSAERLASELNVSIRTIYRDVVSLNAQGATIEGEAGIGYVLRKGADIPPLMFTAEELEALVVGTRFVRAFAGERLAGGAQAALLKIEAVLPPELRQRAMRSRIFAPARWYESRSGAIDRLHEAIAAHRVLRIDYRDGEQRGSLREVEPLCLAFWGGAWTLGAWCRLRTDFRNFRPDRIAAFEPTGETFAETPEHGLAAYLARIGGDSDGIL